MKVPKFTGKRFDATALAADKGKKQAETAELAKLKADVAELKAKPNK